jgi:TonB family protein
MRLFFATLLAFSAIAVHAESANDPVEISVSWDVSIDANGHVTELKATSNKNTQDAPQIRAQVEDAVRGWQFSAGQASTATTRLNVDLSLITQGAAGLSVRVDHAYTGGSIVQPISPPHYPRASINARHEGKVVLRLDYDAAGNSTNAGIDAASANIDQELVNASIDQARTWKFQPETVDARGVAGTIYFPFCFTLKRPTKGEQPPEKYHGCKFTTTSKYGANGEEHVFGLNPTVKLTTDVEGKIL